MERTFLTILVLTS